MGHKIDVNILNNWRVWLVLYLILGCAIAYHAVLYAGMSKRAADTAYENCLFINKSMGAPVSDHLGCDYDKRKARFPYVPF